MKTKVTLSLLALGILPITASVQPPPTYSYSRANFPYAQTLMGILNQQTPGCGCGIGPSRGGNFLAEAMSVSPNSIPNAKLGQPITIRYDASLICRKQTIANLQDVNSQDPTIPPANDNPNLSLGTADWQVGTVQYLPREWGEITYSGYTQSGSYNVAISMNLRCKDIKGQKKGTTCPAGYNICTATATVPVTVQ